MEIRNEIKGKDEKKEFVHRNLADVQRAKLNKLMENPDKPVIIPESRRKEKEYNAPSFIRNVMGSSAGAGSGEFHVYRHLRRKEYARQKNMKAMSEKERLDMEYEEKLEQNQRNAEEKTNKKRQKRLKKKKNQKNKGSKKPKMENDPEASNEEPSSNDEEEEEGESKEASDKEEEENTSQGTPDEKEEEEKGGGET